MENARIHVQRFYKNHDLAKSVERISFQFQRFKIYMIISGQNMHICIVRVLVLTNLEAVILGT